MRPTTTPPTTCALLLLETHHLHNRKASTTSFLRSIAGPRSTQDACIQRILGSVLETASSGARCQKTHLHPLPADRQLRKQEDKGEHSAAESWNHKLVQVFVSNMYDCRFFILISMVTNITSSLFCRLCHTK